MKIVRIQENQYCSECGMPDKFLANLEYAFFCLDCLDRAMKMMLTRIENDTQCPEVIEPK